MAKETQAQKQDEALTNHNPDHEQPSKIFKDLCFPHPSPQASSWKRRRRSLRIAAGSPSPSAGRAAGFRRARRQSFPSLRNSAGKIESWSRLLRLRPCCSVSAGSARPAARRRPPRSRTPVVACWCRFWERMEANRVYVPRAERKLFMCAAGSEPHC